MTEPRYKVFLGWLWLLVLAWAGAFLLSSDVRFRTDIYELLLAKDDNSSQFAVGKALIEKSSLGVRLGVESPSMEEASSAAKELSELGQRAGLQIILSQDNKGELLSSFSKARFFLLDQNSLSILSAENPVEAIVLNLRKKLSSPVGALYSFLLEHDPLLLSAETFREHLESQKGTLIDGSLFFEGPAAVLLGSFEKPPSRHRQKEVIEELEAGIALIRQKFPESQFHWSSIQRFAHSSAKRLETETKVMSFFAMASIVAIILFVFGSIKPLLLTSLSVFCGLLFASAFTKLVLGDIHLITIGFGSSLLGACVDYAIHYQCSVYYGGRSVGLYRAIAVGALTSMLAFLLLLFTDFPGLAELSIFSASALLASVLCVLLFFPYFLNTPSKALPSLPRAFKALSYLGDFYRGLSYPKLCLVLFLTAALASILNLEFNDDIRLLQKPEASLLNDEIWFREKTSPELHTGYVLVTGTSEAELEKKAFASYKTLKSSKLVEHIIGAPAFVRSKNARAKSFELYQELLSGHAKELETQLRELGFSEQLIQKGLDISSNSEPSYQKLSRNSGGLEELYSQLNLGKLGENYHLAMALFSAQPINGDKIQALLKDKQTGLYYSHPEAISELFRGYTKKAIFFVALAYFLIWLLMSYLFSTKDSLLILLPALLSGLATLASMSLVGIPVNFFAILALVIVLGLSVDYAIFSRMESKSLATSASISISALTTVATFSVLLFSSTKVLQSFGFVIAIGVIFAFLFSPVVKLSRPE